MVGRGKGRRRGSEGLVNYHDCLYAFFMARGMFVEAADAQDKLRVRCVGVTGGFGLDWFGFCVSVAYVVLFFGVMG